MVQWTKSAFRTSYRVGNVKMTIPRFLDLPNIQAKHPVYDRFLPILCQHLDSHRLIIDVGSNIGDTLVAISQQCANPILCVEPSITFFPFLVENLKRIPRPERVKTLQVMVGTGDFSGSLEHSVKGTARLMTQAGKDTLRFASLDSIVEESGEIALVKSDTDGFDFDVILSGPGLIRREEPVIFWENEIHGQTQLDGFGKLYAMLEQAGYKYLYVFDNFGNLLLEEATYESLLSINRYLHSMKHSGQSRTFYYVDILASTDKYHSAVINALTAFKKLINEGAPTKMSPLSR